jgi:two-component system, OmpR family, sensor histidine kinase TctE
MSALKPSLHRRVVQHLLVPLVATWALGAAIAVAVGAHFAAEAFDRSLLDDAYALSLHVRSNREVLSLSMTKEEMDTLLFDQNESMYFAVLRADGSLLAGHPALGGSPIVDAGEHQFWDLSVGNRNVRAVSVRPPTSSPYVVVMGSTTASRTRLLQRLVAFSVLPQALLLGLLAWWLRRRLGADLRPLGALELAIDRRNATDLAPLADGIKQDATTREIESIARAVDSLFARLKQSVQGQREFAGTVAHELRTPLAGIRAQAAFALADPEPAVWREQLEGIALAEHRASRLVDQLLALARAGESQEGLAFEPVDLAAAAREVLLRMMPRARAAGVDLGGEGLDDAVTVRADRALVEGILNNLVDNALRYGTGSAEPRITVEVSKTASGTEVSVSDNGEGLPDTGLRSLTERWVQGEQGRRAGDGAGLGLAIVSRYAELLGARLDLRRSTEGGLRIALVFPAG